MKVAIAGIFHETNSFAPVKTTIDDFKQDWAGDRDIFIEKYAGSRTSMGGALDALDQAGWQLTNATHFHAMPGGVVTDEALERCMDRLLASVDQSNDGVLLILHGAMVAESCADVEAEVLRRVRAKIGDEIPIAVTLDLHANISTELIDLATIIVGFDTYPHVDYYERAVEAVQLLIATIKGEIRPTQVLARPGMLIVPEAMRTNEGAMRELMSAAFQFEKEGHVLNITVAGGFPYSDISIAGLSIIVTTNADKAQAEQIADHLAQMAYRMREKFRVSLHSFADAVKQCLQLPPGPVVLAEGSDNIGAGGPADGTHLLREVLSLSKQPSLIIIKDAEVVNHAFEHGIGSAFQMSVGGKSDALHGEPVELEGHVQRLSDGVYQHEGAYQTGRWFDMGKTAVIEVGQVTLVVTEYRTPPRDPAQLKVLGIDPRDYRFIVAKSAVAWQTAYGDVAIADYALDTPGCCTANLHHFAYQHITRPIWPLDESPNE